MTFKLYEPEEKKSPPPTDNHQAWCQPEEQATYERAPASRAHQLLKGDLFLTSRRCPLSRRGVLWAELSIQVTPDRVFSQEEIQNWESEETLTKLIRIFGSRKSALHQSSRWCLSHWQVKPATDWLMVAPHSLLGMAADHPLV